MKDCIQIYREPGSDVTEVYRQSAELLVAPWPDSDKEADESDSQLAAYLVLFIQVAAIAWVMRVYSHLRTQFQDTVAL